MAWLLSEVFLLIRACIYPNWSNKINYSQFQLFHLFHLFYHILCKFCQKTKIVQNICGNIVGTVWEHCGLLDTLFQLVSKKRSKKHGGKSGNCACNLIFFGVKVKLEQQMDCRGHDLHWHRQVALRFMLVFVFSLQFNSII